MGLKAGFSTDTLVQTLPVRESATVTADADFDGDVADGVAVLRFDSTANTGAGGWYIDARVSGSWKSVELT